MLRVAVLTCPTHATVVGEKDDDGLICDATFIERVKHAAHAVVETFHHRGIDRIALRIPRIGELAILRHEFVLRVIRRMDTELPVVRIERAILVLADERHHMRRQRVLDVLTSLALDLQRRREFPRRDVTARRSRSRPVRPIHIEAMLQWRIRLRPEMPLAEMPGAITRLTQHFWQRDIIGLQSRDAVGDKHGLFRVSLRELLLQNYLRQMAHRGRNSRARRPKPRENAAPRRRTKRIRRIGLREFHPSRRKFVEVRRLVILAAVAAKIRPSEVIRHDEEDIRFPRLSCVGGEQCGRRRQE